jgi:hypothetical protein
MKSHCNKRKLSIFNNIESMEKWVFNECNCINCNKHTYFSRLLQSININREYMIQLDELTLTGKMIIKIKMEIVKQKLIDILSEI